MHYLFLGLALCFAYTAQAATLSGLLTDTEGQPLPFATIHIQGTSIGTTANLDGEYTLPLEAGPHKIVFQYVGYQSQTRTVVMTDAPQTLHVQLEVVAQNLTEVTIIAGEDPAYRIIRKAIKKRPFYKNQVNAYTCRSYVKGTQKIKNLPKSIFGQSLESLGQGLDSTGSGIIYLSESVSTLYYQQNKMKEVMSSSKVSGNDNGFSFNSGAAMMSMSFYDNTFDLNGTALLSPIGNSALGTYRYQLETSFYDDEHLVHKIAVTPKNPLAAAFSGYLYIVEEDWAIHSTDLWTTGKAVNISILDTVTIKQTHVQVEGDTWRIFSQDIQFSLGLMAIKTSGNFIGVFNDYNLSPTFKPRFFDAEIFKVEELANEKTNLFWDSIRPVPLSKQEKQEYQVKDSLQVLWKDKSYQDSLDRISNQPGLLNLLSGYTYRNSYGGYQFTIRSPLQYLHYNTIQGQIIGLGLDFAKDANKKKRFAWKIGGEAEYGISDRQFRGSGYAWMRFNEINDAFLYVSGGHTKRQFNTREPIPYLVNTYYSIIGRLNYLKIYNDTYVRIFYRQRIINGLLFAGGLHYGQRRALVNTTDVSWFPNIQTSGFFTNHPLDNGWGRFDPGVASFATHNYLTLSLALRFRLGQKYVSYPNQRFHTGSDFPDFWVRYRKGISLGDLATDYDYLELSFEKRGLDIGTVGALSFMIKGGWFFNNSNLFFMDYAHFDANQTFLAQTDRYLTTFQLMPYYQYSTNKGFGLVALEHDFNGFLWNKIPGLKVLGFEWVVGYRVLVLPTTTTYMEWNIGLDRIGWKLFRFLRVDAVMGYIPGEGVHWGGVVGLDFSL